MSVVNVWSGNLTDTGVSVTAKVTGASTRLAVADNAELSGPVYVGPATPSAQGIVRFDVASLTPDTQYWCAVEDDGVLDADQVCQLRTVGTPGEPYSFTFGHATCAGASTPYPLASALAPSRMSNHPVFDDIRSQGLQLFLHGGDLHYYDIGSGHYTPDASADTYRRGYDDVLASPRQAALYRSCPLVYAWSDHDFGPNDSDRTSPGRDVAPDVYRERVPSYALPATDGKGIFHSFVVGRVLFLVTDQRYYRDPPTQAGTRTMMGADQLAWMDNLLATSDAEFLVWMQEQEWTATATGTSFWGSYAAERAQVIQMLGDHGWLNKMMMLSGDDHSMAWDTGGGNQFGGFPMFMNSPMDSGMTSAPAYYDLGRRSTQTGASRGQWGTFTVTDAGPFVRVQAKGWYYT